LSRRSSARRRLLNTLSVMKSITVREGDAEHRAAKQLETESRVTIRSDRDYQYLRVALK